MVLELESRSLSECSTKWSKWIAYQLETHPWLASRSAQWEVRTGSTASSEDEDIIRLCSEVILW